MRYPVRLLLTIFAGAGGGAVFYYLSLPLPWMLGATCAVAALAVGGGPVVSVRKIRPPLAAIIGVTLGSAFSPEIANRALDWIPLTIAAVISTVLVGTTGTLYLRRIAGFDTVTSFFSAMPAGVYEMTHQGGMMGGDERRIALVHAVRIFLVVLLVPITFGWFFELGSSRPAAIGQGHGALGIDDALILGSCAAFGWLVAKLVHFPNPPMLGPMLASAVVHGVGLTETAPPYVLVSLAQIFLGASIGGQFIGASANDLRRTAAHGLVLVPLSLTICVLIAWFAERTMDLDFPTILLSLAPGGTAEMSLIALALHTEVTAVVAHQVLRVLLIHSSASTVFKLLKHTQKSE